MQRYAEIAQFSVDTAPTDLFFVADKRKPERKDQITERQRTDDRRPCIRLLKRPVSDRTFQRGKIQPSQIGKERRTIGKSKFSEKVAVSQEDVSLFIRKVEIPHAQPESAELTARHRKDGVSVDLGAGNIRLQREQRFLFGQKRRKARRQIIQRRKRFLFRRGHRRIGILFEI